MFPDEEPLVGDDPPDVAAIVARDAFERDLPNARVHELIHQLPDQDHRARVWQGFFDDELVQRTLITETRVSKDWRSQMIDR